MSSDEIQRWSREKRCCFDGGLEEVAVGRRLVEGRKVVGGRQACSRYRPIEDLGYSFSSIRRTLIWIHAQYLSIYVLQSRSLSHYIDTTIVRTDLDLLLRVVAQHSDLSRT
jgi:hypothetical protein